MGVPEVVVISLAVVVVAVIGFVARWANASGKQ
jgi:hypothetical protein